MRNSLIPALFLPLAPFAQNVGKLEIKVGHMKNGQFTE